LYGFFEINIPFYPLDAFKAYTAKLILGRCEIIFMEWSKAAAALSLAFAIMAAGAIAQGGATVTRSVSPLAVAPGGIVTVTLSVDVVSGQRYYVLEEKPPAGWEIVDTGGLVKDSQGYLKYVQLENAADKVYTYTIRAPVETGEYAFSGLYQAEGMGEPAAMGGSLSVASGAPSSMPGAGTNQLPVLATALAVIIIIIICALYLTRKGKGRRVNK